LGAITERVFPAIAMFWRSLGCFMELKPTGDFNKTTYRSISKHFDIALAG
jgi:hypothetical protein